MTSELHVGEEVQKEVSGMRSISSDSEARKHMLFGEL